MSDEQPGVITKFLAVSYMLLALYCMWSFMAGRPLNNLVWMGAGFGFFSGAYDEGRKLGWNK